MIRGNKTVLMAVAAILLVLVGGVAGALISRPSVPAEDSADVGFARDMSEHHAQAVELGMIAHQKGDREEIRNMGGDIALTQQGQIGMMQAWLKDWGYGPTSAAKPMAWMPDGESLLNGNLMPGMATRDEINKLKGLSGPAFDVFFCQLMLRHHLGGIHMVEAELKYGSVDEEKKLADTMKKNQSGEVVILRNLLTDLKAAPLPA